MLTHISVKNHSVSIAIVLLRCTVDTNLFFEALFLSLILLTTVVQWGFYFYYVQIKTKQTMLHFLKNFL